MKRSIFAVLILLLVLACNAQPWKPYIDSAINFRDQSQTSEAIEYFKKAAQTLKKDSFFTTTNSLNSYNIGVLYFQSSQFEEAEHYFIEEQTIETKLGAERADYAVACTNLGLLYQAMKQYEKAESLYLQAKAIRERLFGKNNLDAARFNNNLAGLYYVMPRFDKAVPLLLETQETIKMAAGTQNLDYVTSGYMLGNIYYMTGEYSKSETKYVEVRQIISLLFGMDHPYYASSCNELGVLYRDMKRYGMADTLLNEAIVLREKLLGKTHPDYLSSCNNLAALYIDMGSFKKAEAQLLILKETVESLGDTNQLVYNSVCDNLARVYSEEGRIPEGIELTVKVLRQRVLLVGKSHPDYASSCGNLAELYRQTGQYDKAEPLLIEARAVREKLGGKLNIAYANATADLANFYNSYGQFDKAEASFNEAIDILKKIGQEESLLYGITCGNLAMLYLSEKKYDESEALLLQAKPIMEQAWGVGNSIRAQLYHNLGLLYEKTDRDQQARDLYLRALDLIEKSIGKNNSEYAGTCNNLGDLSMRTNNYDQAQKYYEQAREGFKNSYGELSPQYSLSFSNMAAVHWAKKQPELADAQFRQLLAISEKQTNTVFEFTSENEKTQFIRNTLEKEDVAMSFYISQKFPSDIPYLLSLFHRNLVLSASTHLREQILASTADSLKTKYDHWIDVRKSLAMFNSRITARQNDTVSFLEQTAEELEKELTRASPDFARQQHAINCEDIRQGLRENEAAIEFVSFRLGTPVWFTDSICYAALIIKKNVRLPIAVFLCMEKQLQEVLQASGDQSADHAINQLYQNNASTNIKSLYDLVWKPMQNSLKGISTVYFAAAGLLHRLAFAAIPSGPNKVLSDEFKLIQLTTTALVPNFKPSELTRADQLQLFGGIKYDVDSATLKQSVSAFSRKLRGDVPSLLPGELTRNSLFDFLPGTALEVGEIARLAKAKNFQASVYSGVDASEESFKSLGGKSSPAVIHVATHGFFFPDPSTDTSNKVLASFETSGKPFKQSDDPLFRAGLVFSGSNLAWQGKPIEGIDDGILTAYEVSNMYLPTTKLVVLSACETALGDIEGSEGVYGLQRAFKMAGVEDLLMSLWKVSDEETSEFMKLFYEKLFNGISVHESFYQTQETMKNKYRDQPFKWAAWILIR